MHLRCFAVLEQFFIKYFFASYFLELIIYSPFATNRPRQHQRLAIVAGEIRFSTSMHSYVFATTTTCAASDSFPHFHGHPHRSCIYLCSVWFDSPCNRKYFGGRAPLNIEERCMLRGCSLQGIVWIPKHTSSLPPKSVNERQLRRLVVMPITSTIWCSPLLFVGSIYLVPPTTRRRSTPSKSKKDL